MQAWALRIADGSDPSVAGRVCQTKLPFCPYLLAGALLPDGHAPDPDAHLQQLVTHAMAGRGGRQSRRAAAALEPGASVYSKHGAGVAFLACRVDLSFARSADRPGWSCADAALGLWLPSVGCPWPSASPVDWRSLLNSRHLADSAAGLGVFLLVRHNMAAGTVRDRRAGTGDRPDGKHWD